MSAVVDGVMQLRDGLLIDLASGTVRGPAGELRLEARLARLLSKLVAAKGAVVARGELVDDVWGGRPVGDDAIDSAICRLRLALGDNHKVLIQTLPKRGYRLAPDIRPTSVDALCARGEVALDLWDPVSTRLAMSCFDAAVSEAPENGRALAGAALSRLMLCLFGACAVEEALADAGRQLQAAKAAGTSYALFWIAGAALQFLRERDAAAALDMAAKGVALAPGSALALVWRSQINLAAGRMFEAVEDAKTASALDRNNVGVRANRVAILFLARRFGECRAVADRDLEEVGSSLGLLAYKGWSLLFSGETERAIAVMASSWRARPGRTESLQELERAFEEGGVAAYFRMVAKLTSSDVAADIVRPVDRAVLWAMAGELDKAMAALRLAEQRGDLRLRWMAILPQFDALQHLEEFQKMCARQAP